MHKLTVYANYGKGPEWGRRAITDAKLIEFAERAEVLQLGPDALDDGLDLALDKCYDREAFCHLVAEMMPYSAYWACAIPGTRIANPGREVILAIGDRVFKNSNATLSGNDAIDAFVTSALMFIEVAWLAHTPTVDELVAWKYELERDAPEFELLTYQSSQYSRWRADADSLNPDTVREIVNRYPPKSMPGALDWICAAMIFLAATWREGARFIDARNNFRNIIVNVIDSLVDECRNERS